MKHYEVMLAIYQAEWTEADVVVRKRSATIHRLDRMLADYELRKAQKNLELVTSTSATGTSTVAAETIEEIPLYNEEDFDEAQRKVREEARG